MFKFIFWRVQEGSARSLSSTKRGSWSTASTAAACSWPRRPSTACVPNVKMLRLKLQTVKNVSWSEKGSTSLSWSTLSRASFSSTVAWRCRTYRYKISWGWEQSRWCWTASVCHAGTAASACKKLLSYSSCICLVNALEYNSKHTHTKI